MFVTFGNFIHDVEHLGFKVETAHLFVGRINPFLLPFGIREAPNVLHALRNNRIVDERFSLVSYFHTLVMREGSLEVEWQGASTRGLFSLDR